jgi:succinyl-CoA synthetase alpha subunit
MRATELSGLLKEGDRVAVSNITGREASKVSEVSQKYCGNIVGGWALGKGGQRIETPAGDIPVFSTFEELLRLTPKENHPNKIIIFVNLKNCQQRVVLSTKKGQENVT